MTERERLIELIKHKQDGGTKYGDHIMHETKCSNAELADYLLENGIITPVKHGHWVLLRESEITGFNPEFAGRDPIGGYQCSNCKKEAIFDCNDEFVLSSYCPNCGVRMDEDEK